MSVGSQIIFPDVDPIHQDFPLRGIVKAQQELDQGGFACAVVAHQGARLVFPERKADVVQDLSLPGLIGKAHVPKLDAANPPLRKDPVAVLRDGRLAGQKIPQVLNEQTVFHTLHQGSGVSDQNPGDGGHQSSEHRKVGERHGF